jgi:hypothetical protein
MAMPGRVMLPGLVGMVARGSVMGADAHDRGFGRGPSEATAKYAEDDRQKQLLHTLVLLQTSLFITISQGKFQ